MNSRLDIDFSKIEIRIQKDLLRPRLDLSLTAEHRSEGRRGLLIGGQMAAALDESRIYHSLYPQDPSAQLNELACESLVRLANERGGFDNVTTLVVRYEKG